MAEIDSHDFRRAASHFMTGVTIVTTVDAAGAPAGLTVNSFSTVSLDPPLVLFCLGLESDTYQAFRAGNGYAVHVLGGDQMDLAVGFAAHGIDRFDGVRWSAGHDGLPLLPDALATFQCDLVVRHPAGDHDILVGEVVDLAYAGLDREALGYFRGRYITRGASD